MICAPSALCSSHWASIIWVAATEWPGKMFVRAEEEKGQGYKKRTDNSRQETKRIGLTIDQVLNAAEACRHLGLLVGLGRALELKLGKEAGLCRLHLQLGRLEVFRLLGKLGGQAVPLLRQLAALRLLATKGGLDFAQLLLHVGISL